jgi:cytochrome c oxidase cbb3-type subunit 3
MQRKIIGAALIAAAFSRIVLAQDTVEGPRVEIANPNATFLPQQRALPPADVIERGNGLYQVNCMACHGRDLRGGDQGGPNLLRADIVLNDVEGELIGELVRNGQNRMPANTSLDAEEIRAIAGYIHSVTAQAQGQGAPPRVEYDLEIVVGDARRGERYFNRECAMCHSATGDLAGIATAIDDPVTLQNSWVAGRRQGRGGGPAPAQTVTVTPRDGEPVTGELLRYDDFFVSLRLAGGEYRSYTRVGGEADVAIVDPLAGHKALWRTLEDDAMHDVTAYLETLK